MKCSARASGWAVPEGEPVRTSYPPERTTDDDGRSAAPRVDPSKRWGFALPRANPVKAPPRRWGCSLRADVMCGPQ